MLLLLILYRNHLWKTINSWPQWLDNGMKSASLVITARFQLEVEHSSFNFAAFPRYWVILEVFVDRGISLGGTWRNGRQTNQRRLAFYDSSCCTTIFVWLKLLLIQIRCLDRKICETLRIIGYIMYRVSFQYHFQAVPLILHRCRWDWNRTLNWHWAYLNIFSLLSEIQSSLLRRVINHITSLIQLRNWCHRICEWTLWIILKCTTARVLIHILEHEAFSSGRLIESIVLSFGIRYKIFNSLNFWSRAI